MEVFVELLNNFYKCQQKISKTYSLNDKEAIFHNKTRVSLQFCTITDQNMAVQSLVSLSS